MSPVKSLKLDDSFLTFGQNRLIFWGTALELQHCQFQPIYNDKKRYFEFPLLPEIIRHLTELLPKARIDHRLPALLSFLEMRVSAFEDLKNAKTAEDDLEDVGLKGTTLFDHQKIACQINEIMPRVLCLDEMGLGKTVVAIRSALHRKATGQTQRCLVICPNSIKSTVWVREIELRTGLKACAPSGTWQQRQKELTHFLEQNASNTDYHFVIINYEMTYKYFNLISKWVNGQMLIVDESHCMKNRAAERTKAIFKLEPKYSLVMTGTPFDNRVEDVYALGEFVCPLIFGGSFTRFKDRYCVEQPLYLNRNGKSISRTVISGYKNLDELKKLLGLISYRRTKKEVLNLPEKTYESRFVRMSNEQWKAYEDMRKDCYVLITQSNDVEIESVANGILAKMLRLSQITDGYLTDFAEKDRAHWVQNGGKLAELNELLEQIIDYGGHKVVVWSRFVEVVRFLTDFYKEKYGAVFINGEVPVDDRAGIVEDFQVNPSTKLFIAQIQSCGVGMTLHSASYEIFFDKCFVPSSSILQAEDRCHRIGMKGRLTIISLIAQGTIDEHWEKILTEKLSAADQVLGEDTANRYSKDDTLTKTDLLELLKTNKKGSLDE